MLKKVAARCLTAGALVLLAPTVASASSDSYTGTPGVTVDDPIIEPCGASTIVFEDGYFLPSEKVGVSVSGLNAADSEISGKTAAADGSLVVTFRPPSDGEGAYEINFAGTQTSDAAAVVTVASGGNSTKCDDPIPAAAMELPLTAGGIELSSTGGSVSPWVLGGGAAALVAGGVLVAVGVTRRKRA